MEEKDPLIIAEFKRRRNLQLIVCVTMIAAIIPVLMAKDMGTSQFPAWLPTQLVLPVCFFVFIAGVIFSLINWRCPVCKGYLGKSFAPRYCQQCGAQLQE
jgi:hypothetical protein